MKVGFPVQSDEGMDSVVYGHFGSAPAFMIVDTERNEAMVLDNANRHHEHGACNPVMALNGNEIHAMIVGGIGPGALMKLNAIGIKVYGAGALTVKENIDLLNDDALEELSMNHSCRAHQGGCSN